MNSIRSYLILSLSIIYYLFSFRVGTLYQIYVSATNEFGVGDPSEIITMRTHKSLASDMTNLLSTALFGESGDQPALLNLFVLVPVLASLVTIIVVVIVTCVCLHRIKARHARAMLAGQVIMILIIQFIHLDGPRRQCSSQ